MDRAKILTGIRGWPEGERPRERLLKEGERALTDAQLLAIILRTGRSRRTAVEVAMDLLRQFDGLTGIADATPLELDGVLGLGPAKAAQVKAAIELGRRILSGPGRDRGRFRSSQDVYSRYGREMAILKKEVFKSVLVDSKHRFIREETVSIGSLNLNIVHPREVFKAAIRDSAAAVILLHNHPSGDPSPSLEDRELTKRLAEAGVLLGIEVLDHLVIGADRFVSFADEGWISRNRPRGS